MLYANSLAVATSALYGTATVLEKSLLETFHPTYVFLVCGLV